jgi:hypothetical protein
VSRYRKKPVVIDAIQWTGENVDECIAFLRACELVDDGQYVGGAGIGHTPALGTLDIPTLEGVMTASAGDWLIRGVKGEAYPCKPDIFDATYELVEDAS